MVKFSFIQKKTSGLGFQTSFR